MRIKSSVALPATMLFDPWLRDVDLRVWCAYAAHADISLETTVTIAEIAKQLNVTSVTVKRALASLSKAGYVAKPIGGSSPKRQLVVN